VKALEERNLLTALVVAPSPQFPGRLYATAAIADNDIWAVGSAVEHFDGKSWSVVPTPSIPNSGFFGVSGVASNDVWAVGSNNGEPLIEHWNGTSWRVVTSPTIGGEDDALLSVAAVSSNNVWAVGRTSGNALVEHWNGTGWRIVTNSVIAGAGGLSAVSADAANDVWAVGEAGNGGPPLLHFNGTTWSQLHNPPISMQANAVLALSPTDVWAVGKTQYAANHRVHFRASIEHWDGTSWSIVASPATSDTSLNGIAAISANDILAVGGGTATSLAQGTSATLAEEWNGTSWGSISSANPGNATNGLSAVTALSDGTVVAVGFQENHLSDATPLILHNAASGAKLTNAPRNAATTHTTLTPRDTGRQDRLFMAGTNADRPLWPGGNGIAGRLASTPLRAALLDELFAAAGKGDRPLPFAGRAWWAQGAARDAVSDGLAEGLWRWDRV
jgi:hypothetical protein